MKNKYLVIYAVSIFTLNSYSQDCNIGNSEVTSEFNSSNTFPNFLLGGKYTLSEVGTLNSINLIGNGTGGNVQMAVYDDNSGVPNNLIVSSNIGTVGNGLTTFNITPLLLNPGDYWVMAIYESQGDHCNVDSDIGVVNYYKSMPFGNPIPTNASDFNIDTNLNFLYFLDITCGNILSINDFNKKENITLYPNPSNDFIQISGLSKTENYQVYSIIGTKVQSGKTSNNKKINIKNLNEGMYILRFDSGYTIKFIKQ